MNTDTDQLCTWTRAQNGCLKQPVPDSQLHRLYGRLKGGPSPDNIGRDVAQIDPAFWAGTKVGTHVICTLGHGNPAKVLPRSPRLSFEQACQLV